MNSIIKITVLMVFSFAITSCQSQPLRLNANDFEDAIKQKEVQLIDIRTQGEYSAGHIKNAINIDFYSSDFIKRINQLNKSKPLYIYCASGNRSGQALIKISTLKFNELADLQGGLHSWESSRKEIIK
jgi:rhodanese-related sulfurtransferase